MKIHEYNEMMRYLTRPAPDPSFKQQVAGWYGTQGTYSAPEELSPMPNIEDLIREEGIQVGEQVAEGGRVGMKPGGLVEPGVTHYATSPVKKGKFKYPVTNQHGTVWRDKPFIHKPLSTTQQKLADTIKKEIDRSLTSQELTRIRQNKVTKVSEFRSFIPADTWKETTDKIKKLRLEKVNINLSDEAFAKKLNDVYEIKTRSRKLWSNVSVGELQKSLKISDEVGAKATRSLDEIKKIVRTLKKGEQILKDFEAGKISETQLRSKAAHKVYQTKPETKIRLEKWMKENPEIVRAMEEQKQMRGWSRSSFPRMGKNAKSNIWANLHENVRKERGRIELIDDNVIYEKDGTVNWKREGKNGKPNWQNVKFKDKVKNAVFTWDNLEKKVDNVFGKNAYKRFAFPYEARNQLTEATITYKGNERSVGSVLNDGLLKKHYKRYARPGETFDAFKARKAKGFGTFEANHMYANDPWQTQLTFRDSNRALSHLDDTFQKELRMAVDDPKKTKQITQNFINKIRKLPGGIEWNIGDQMIGKKPSVGSVTEAAFGETGLTKTLKANPQLKKFIQDNLVEETGSLLKGAATKFPKTTAVLKSIFETKTPLGAAFWALEAPLLMLQGTYNRYANERDFKAGLKRMGVPDEAIEQLGEVYGQELADFGQVGLESWAVDQPDTFETRKMMTEQMAEKKPHFDISQAGPLMVKQFGAIKTDEREMQDYEEQLKQLEIERRTREAYEKYQGRSTGGRVPFGKGGMGRREFMKWLAGITGAGIAAGTGLLKWGAKKGAGKTVIKAGDHIIQGTPGMPDWFIPLVNRIVKEGDDVTKKLGTIERETVHTAKIKGHDVDVYQDLNTGNIRVSVEGGTGKNLTAYDEGLELEYKAGEVIEEGKHAGKKTDPEFSTSETEAGYVRTGPDDAELDFGAYKQGEGKSISDTNFLKNYAKKKKPNMGQIVETGKKKKEIKYLKENPHEDPRIPEFDDSGMDDLFDEFGNYIGD